MEFSGFFRVFLTQKPVHKRKRFSGEAVFEWDVLLAELSLEELVVVLEFFVKSEGGVTELTFDWSVLDTSVLFLEGEEDAQPEPLEHTQDADSLLFDGFRTQDQISLVLSEGEDSVRLDDKIIHDFEIIRLDYGPQRVNCRLFPGVGDLKVDDSIDNRCTHAHNAFLYDQALSIYSQIFSKLAETLIHILEVCDLVGFLIYFLHLVTIDHLKHGKGCSHIS